jgi:hypothetical protein
MTEFIPIPPSIVSALCKVQASIEAVSKTSFNQQGKYKFASADDIYAAVARKFGEAGLMILPLEMAPPTIERVEKEYTDDRSGEKSTKVSQWGKFTFGYVLATAEATWFDPRSSRTIFIQLLGPQTFNAAESYCQKQFLRALLKLPTGDMDLDSLPQADNEDDQVKLTAPRRPKSSASAKRDGTTETFNEILRAVKGAPTLDVLEQIPTLYADDIGTLPRAWHDVYEGEYETRLLHFGGKPQAAE